MPAWKITKESNYYLYLLLDRDFKPSVIFAQARVHDRMYETRRTL